MSIAKCRGLQAEQFSHLGQYCFTHFPKINNDLHTVRFACHFTAGIIACYTCIVLLCCIGLIALVHLESVRFSSRSAFSSPLQYNNGYKHQEPCC